MDDTKKSVREPSRTDSAQCDLHAEWLKNPHEVAVMEDIMRQAKAERGKRPLLKH